MRTGIGHADLIALATAPDYTPRHPRLKRETGLQRRVKQSGGNLIFQKRAWEIHYDRAEPPGLKKRIVKLAVSEIRHHQVSNTGR
jgi:hypothetical protein